MPGERPDAIDLRVGSPAVHAATPRDHAPVARAVLAAPDTRIGRVRRLFFMFAAVQAAFFALRVAVVATDPRGLRAQLAVLVMAATALRARGLLRGRVTAVELALEGGVLALVTALLPEPREATGLLYAGLAFRALFGPRTTAAAAAGAYAVAYAAGLAAADRGFRPVDLGIMGGLVMAATASTLLARIVRDDERVRTAAGALALADARMAQGTREQILAAALDAALALAGDRDARALAAAPGHDGLRVAAAAGARAGERVGAAVALEGLPAALLLRLLGGEAVALGPNDGAARRALGGDDAVDGAALAVPLLARGDLRGVLLVESAAPLPDEARASLGALGARVALVLESVALTGVVERGTALFHAIVQGAADVVALVDDRGGLVYLSPSAARFVGGDAARLVGTSPVDFVHPDDRAATVAAGADVLADADAVRRVACRLRDAEGAWRPCSALLCAPPAPDGARRTLLVSVHDESAQRRAEEALRRAEEQLRQTQKMEAIGRLAGGVAHDFNNLLAVILSYGHLLRDALDADDPRREDVAEICSAAERGAALSRQLLAFSRRQALRPETVDVDAALRGLDRMLQRLLGADVRVETRLASGAAVRVDPGHFEQVVLNLAINARDAMPDGGTLSLRTEVVAGAPPPLRCEGPCVAVTVADTGCGMTEETRARIFEPFFTTKAQGKGTGLGLATVFGVVHQSGGAIDVQTAPGRGTTFTVYLPRVEPARDASAAGEPARPSAAAGAETVLLVEDEAPLRALARRVLEARGYTVLEAGDGAEALAASRGHAGAIDLVVADVVLPGEAGPVVVARLRAERPRLRALLVSGHPERAPEPTRRRAGAPPFLAKPFTPEVLAHAVRRALDGTRAPSA